MPAALIVHGRKQRWAKRFSVGAFALALTASLVWLVLPIAGSMCLGTAAYGAPGGGIRCLGGVQHSTLIEENGAHVLLALALPVVIAAVPLAIRQRAVRTIAAAALLVFAFVTGFSIGGFYLPSALAMVAAASRRTTTPGEVMNRDQRGVGGLLR